ncbi:hypothetical protein LIER_29952 [Lithospermum erythrorhizon]|uniref:Uncharacterized protein n=1 Tax=Lithospermum erythrorhizon TaxID=34254 RepID=A0AAV3RPI8_LITER
MEYVGREVKKKLKKEGEFLGTVKLYDEVRGLFEIVYEDGDSEVVNLSQIDSLFNLSNCVNYDNLGVENDQDLEEFKETEVSRKVFSSRNVGRPRKRRRVNVGKKPSNSNSDLGKVCLDLNEEAFVVDDRVCNENGRINLDLNRNDEGGVEFNSDLSRNGDGGSEFNLNLSRNDDCSVGFNLDLNRIDRDVNQGNGCLDLNKGVENQGLEMEGCLDRVGIIDLNVDVNEAGVVGEDRVSELEDCSAGLKRKDRNFDLNLGLEDETRTLDSDSHVLVKDTEENVEAEVNCENQGLCSAVCSVYVEQETPVKKSASEFMDDVLRGPSADSTIGAENVGSESKVKRGRKRKKILGDNMPSITETVLRRSSRRARVAPLSEQVPGPSTLEAGDDSSAISGVSEEKVTVPSPAETTEHLALPPKVVLPPSSGTFSLEGMSGLDVFSVYSFLRTFSKLLFLSPFELEDFVAAIRSNVSNILFDSIHVSLLHALRKHMVSLADDSLQCASDCLRFLNWDLLDMITWPVFLVEYLLMHKHSVPVGFDLHHLKLSGTDYYSQPVYIKIEVLQCLCDEVTGAESIRSELNRRTQGTELSPDSNRSTKLYRSKRRAAADGVGRTCLAEEETDEKEDWNSDECCLCKMDGSLICCDGCPAAFHSRCVGVTNNLLPEGDWYCPECRIEKNNPGLKVGKSIRGAELLGTDPFGRLFYSSCGYLLVSEFSDGSSSLKYYHRNDLFSVIEALKSYTVHYHHILNLICKHWRLSSPVEVLKTVEKPVDIETDINNSLNMEMQIGSSVSLDCTNKLSKIHEDPETPEIFPVIGEHPLTSASSEIEQGKIVTSPPRGHSSSWTVAGSVMLQGDSLSSYVNHYNFSLTSSSIVEHLAHKESDNKPEKATRSAEDIISGQLKAISSTFSEFSWPNIYNQNADSKKEKCGWCYYCQFPEYEMGCFFVNKGKHFALENYTSEALGVHLHMNRKGHLVDVMCHILYMEDRLQGLLLGPWLHPDYSKMWRESVRKASDVDALKKLLLKLESNIRHLAVSADWLKPLDTVLAVGSAYFVTRGSQRMPSKQGNGRKKARYMDPEVNSSSKSGPCLFWWRGGNISRELFNHMALPHYLARKAARQAGCKKLPDILYPENSEVSRRNRSIAWRAALEASSSVQQLALQVRELDSNIKWDEIENTSIISLIEKVSKKPNRSFKKVIIRRKCSKGIISKYLLDFGKRRFIPDVVLKHGNLFEDSSNERKRYWLEETYVPLHLLKLFEEKRIARKPAKAGFGEVENGRTLKKPFWIKGFSYLFSKAERSENYQCGHCNKDVLIRDAVSCQYCKGFFHKRHVKSSGGSISTRCTYTCHKCREGPRKKLDARNSISVTHKSIKAVKINRMPLKIRTKTGRGKQYSKLQAKRKYQVVLPLRRSPRNIKSILPQKPKSKGKKRWKQNRSNKDSVKKAVKETLQRKRTEMYHCYWLNGLRLSRKPNDERAMKFRTNNIMAITEKPTSTLDQPKCSLCGELEITPMLNYIACEFCGDWFHGDAFDLTAERLSSVIGFKCHKCRSVDAPGCPYLHAKRIDNVISGEPFTAPEEEGTARRSRRKRVPRILQ